jgi:8-oxo-dGTP diphosphatase
MTYSTHIVAVGGLVRDPVGRVLLIKSPRRGWEFPGGQVEEGETLTRALEREVAEEAGVTISVGSLVGVYTNVTPPTKVMFGFRCDWLSGEQKASEESLESEWFDPAAAVGLVTYPTYVDRLRDLLEFTAHLSTASTAAAPIG